MRSVFRFRHKSAQGPEWDRPRAGNEAPGSEDPSRPAPRVQRRASAEMAAPVVSHWAEDGELALLDEEQEERARRARAAEELFAPPPADGKPEKTTKTKARED